PLPQDPGSGLAPGAEARRTLLGVSAPIEAGAAAAPASVTVLAGPTAVGKGTGSASIRARYPQIWLSVSATTRLPRGGEVDLVHHQAARAGERARRVESFETQARAVVQARQRYGEPRAQGMLAEEEWPPVPLENELAGARQAREPLPAARVVFLAPPD